MQMVNLETIVEMNMSKSKTLFDYMTPQQQKAMSYVNSKGEVKRYPTWHSICMEKTGVSRPGKTARDRAKHIRRMMS
jgi:hypothetical protein